MKQRGFTIVSAIFLLVVLAALGAFIVTVSTMSQTATALDIQSARAYQAARTGIEWGVYQVNINNSCPSGNLAIPATATTLTPFTVTISCTAHTDTTNGGPTVHEVQATACNRPNGGNCPGIPGLNYVERSLKVTF